MDEGVATKNQHQTEKIFNQLSIQRLPVLFVRRGRPDALCPQFFFFKFLGLSAIRICAFILFFYFLIFKF